MNTYLKFSTGELLKLGLVEKVVKVKIFCTADCHPKIHWMPSRSSWLLEQVLVRGYLAKGLTKGLKIEP